MSLEKHLAIKKHFFDMRNDFNEFHRAINSQDDELIKLKVREHFAHLWKIYNLCDKDENKKAPT